MRLDGRAIREKVRVDWRARGRGLLALALLIGVASGLMIAAQAAARRTDSVLDRFNAQYRLPDQALLLNPFLPEAFVPTEEQIAALPGVRQASLLRQVTLPTGRNERGEIGGIIPSVAAPHGVFSRVRMLEGRLPRPERPDEIIAGLGFVQRSGWRVGTRVPVTQESLVFRPLAEMTGGEATLTVVGIFVATDALPEVHSGGVPFVGTPALFERLPAETPYRIEVYLTDPSVRPAFEAGVERLAAGRRFMGATDARGVIIVPAQRAFGLQASALRLLALVGGLSLALVFSQTLSRLATSLASNAFVLRALGMTPRQQWAASTIVLSAVGLAGGLIAGLVAYLVSPVAPLGDARAIELQPGLSFDAIAIGVGAAIVVGVVAALAALLSARAVRRSAEIASGTQTQGDMPSGTADALANAGLPPAAVIGARFAFERRRGRTALPSRTTIAEVALSVAGFAMALTTLAGLNHFLDTPRLYGTWWDERFVYFGTDARSREQQILLQPGVTGLVFGVYHDRLNINGTLVHTDRISAPVRGRHTMPVVEGRLPSAPDEIALGRRTMHELGVRIGDDVRVGVTRDAAPQRMRVVGVAVFEVTLPLHGLGSGAVITFDAGERLGLARVPAHASVVLDERVTSRAAFRAGLAEWSPDKPQFTRTTTPASVLNFANVRALPAVLAAILGLFGVATLLHATVSVIRLRRRELAILKAIGFDRRQTARTVAWQATLIAAAGVAIGLPLGILAGRFLWLRIVADAGGVPVTHLPIVALALVPVAAVATALFVAAGPARRAATTPAATTLRAE